MSPIYIYDPTANDPLSQVRGVGRYLQVLRENLREECTFTSLLHSVPYDSIFINPFLNFLVWPTITRRIAKKQIAVIHDLIPLKYPEHFPVGIRGSLFTTLNKYLLNTYDHIITDSDASKKDIVTMLSIPENRIHVVYPVVANVFHHSEVASASTLPDSIPQTYYIYVGDATWNKNLINLAKAIKIANIPCVFVGKVFSTKPSHNPWQKEFRTFQELALHDKNFVFPGFVSDKDLQLLYQDSICNILVSKDEGFGFSYLEAATLGVASVLSDIPVLRETAQDTALFADPNNPEHIAKQIRIIASDPKVRIAYASLSKKRSEFFNPAQFKKQILSVCLK